MEVLHELKPNNGIAIALGYFDGIHIGHKKIISTLVQQAKLKGIKSAAERLRFLCIQTKTPPYIFTEVFLFEENRSNRSGKYRNYGGESA